MNTVFHQIFPRALVIVSLLTAPVFLCKSYAQGGSSVASMATSSADPYLQMQTPTQTDADLSQRVRDAIQDVLTREGRKSERSDTFTIAPRQPTLIEAKVTGEKITIDLSSEIFDHGFGGHALEDALSRIYFAAGEAMLGKNQHIEFTTLIEGKPLAQFFAQDDAYAKGKLLSGESIKPFTPKAGASPLVGRRIAISPGHGYYQNTSGVYVLQREVISGIVEDFVNAEITINLKQFLDAGGALVRSARNLDKSAGLGISKNPKWQESAREHIRALGVNYNIWNSSTEDINDDIRCRPLYANWLDAGSENADALVSIHNNGGGGTGSETLYDTTNGQQVESRKLADAVHKKIIDTIRAKYDPAWVDRGVKGFDGSYGENRLATRPAIIAEIAFMDRPSPDNAALRDEKFKTLVAEAISQGLADYFAALTDNMPPTVPTGVALRNANGDVLVSWDAASDNVGVTGYRIYRDGVQVGISTSLSFTDVALIAGRTHRYTVIAHDAAGNPSAASTGITITVDAGPTATPRENRNPIDAPPFSCSAIPNDKRCK